MGSEREELRAKVWDLVWKIARTPPRLHGTDSINSTTTDAILSLLSPELGGWRGIEEAKAKAATMCSPEADGQDYHDGFMCGLTTLAHLLQQPLPPPPTGARLDPRAPRPNTQGIFRDHNCWKCNDGALPCALGNPNNCEYPHARND